MVTSLFYGMDELGPIYALNMRDAEP